MGAMAKEALARTDHLHGRGRLITLHTRICTGSARTVVEHQVQATEIVVHDLSDHGVSKILKKQLEQRHPTA